MISPESHSDPAQQAELFGGQSDLFGAPEPSVYVPDPRHVRNRLERLISQMREANRWPWEPVIVRLHRERNVPYLLGLLPDEEAAQLRFEFETEMARLEAA